MHMIKDLIRQLSSVPVHLQLTDHQPLNGQGFTFASYRQQIVYGTMWKNQTPTKQAWIVLFHGLGAHTNTEGYLGFVQQWLNEGYDVIGMDIRNQGGRTFEHLPNQTSELYLIGYPAVQDYYYTHIYLDAYRLIDVSHQINPNHKIIVNGGSQGGALALFTAAMHPKVNLVLADMPSNTDLNVLINESTGGFRAFKTMPSIEPWLYETIDILNYANMIHQPVLLSSGSLDTVCPLQTCEHLYQRLSTKKAMFIYHGFGHGGYDHLHFPQKLTFIEQYMT